jgi:hypothetical protein
MSFSTDLIVKSTKVHEPSFKSYPPYMSFSTDLNVKKLQKYGTQI